MTGRILLMLIISSLLTCVTARAQGRIVGCIDNQTRQIVPCTSANPSGPSREEVERRRREEERAAEERRNKADAQTYAESAKIEMNRGDWLAAIGWYRKALNLTPDDVGIEHLLATAESHAGEAAFDKHDWQTAVGWFRDAVKNNTTDPYFKNWLALAEQQLEAVGRDNKPLENGPRQEELQQEQVRLEQERARRDAEDKRQQDEFMQRKGKILSSGLKDPAEKSGLPNSVKPFEWPNKVDPGDTLPKNPVVYDQPGGRLPNFKFQKTETVNVWTEIPAKATETKEAIKAWVQTKKKELSDKSLEEAAELDQLKKELAARAKEPRSPEVIAQQAQVTKKQSEHENTEKKLKQLAEFSVDFTETSPGTSGDVKAPQPPVKTKPQ